MDDETRAVAKEKADAMNEQIGYPDMLTNPAELNQEYIMLNVTHGQFLVNILNVLHYEATAQRHAFVESPESAAAPGRPEARPGQNHAVGSMPAKHVLCAVLATTVVFAALAAADAGDNGTHVAAVAHRRNDRAPQGGSVPDRAEARGDQYELISTSSSSSKDKVASADLPVADKQYDYPLVRPVYAPFVTRPSVPSYAMPFVEILGHHRDPPYEIIDHNHRDPPTFVTTQKPGHYMGSPMVSTVVVQDLSQTPPRPPRPPLPSVNLDHDDVVSMIDNFHHLNPTKIPFTDVKVVTKPLGAKPSGKPPGRPARPPNFTDKLEETSLENSSGAGSDEDEPLLENPPNLDMGGIVEEVVKKVFRENQVLHDAATLLPTAEPGLKSWPCPPVTCCSRGSDGPASKCSTFVKCVSGRQCPTRAERVPQALALSKPSNGYTNATDPEADVRDGEPRFKKKKILKKKKKLLKKFLLPLLLAYKLLFLLIVPMLVNGMMMMMSSSGMAGFFFALIGASITMLVAVVILRPQHLQPQRLIVHSVPDCSAEVPPTGLSEAVWNRVYSSLQN
ncbi:hypothetical protein FOCC_FOCC016174 [Frankliniella occidentalis]|nr:hypothetical protein FOCC_FOCC016174 [Frankliniella occidentalis]